MHRTAVAVLCLFVLPAPRAAAWNELGHMVVAKLAYDQMDDGLKLKIDKLLKTHPHYDENLARNCPPGVPVAEWAFLRASVWPDWIRPQENDPRGERVLKFHRPGDHYVTIAFIRPEEAHLFPDVRTDPDVQDVLSAFKQRMSEVKLREGAPSDKAVAICWIEHLIGDIHQPLHCTTLFSPMFPTGDMGGNSFGLKIGGTGHQLHKFWDDILGSVPGSGDDPAERQAKLYEAVKKGAEELRAPEYRRDKLSEYAENQTFPSWVRESHSWGVRVGYRNGALKGVFVKYREPIPEAAPEAGAEYETTARDLARKRAALAAHRLADKLKDALAKVKVD